MTLREGKPGISRVFAVLAVLLCLGGGAASGRARDVDPAAASALESLKRSVAGRLVAREALETRAYAFVHATGGGVLAADDVAAAPEVRALRFVAARGEIFGLEPASRTLPGTLRLFSVRGDELVVARVERDALGQSHVRIKQLYQGLPVFGAELVVHMDGRGILGANGLAVPGITVDPSPSIPADAAAKDALDRVRKTAAREEELLSAARSDLVVYRVGLLEGFPGENRLAWAVEVAGEAVRELVFVDAHTGELLQQVPLSHDALYRVVYTPQYDPNNPDLFVARKEGDPPNLLPGNPVDNLYDFAGETYAMFHRGFGRDSYDGNGISMRSVYLVNEACPNAYWNGQATHYCPTFDVDDVVSHEWGHAYTQFTHNLVYSYQSGALNESYSDIWGESLDLINGRDGAGGSNNTQPAPAGQRWLMGEDVPVLNQPAVGILRDMWSPPRFGDPDRVGSSLYHCGTDDGGGVHTNSGVPNHAYAMLVDGKTFNGQTVQPIGFVKATQIYYRAMVVYQFPTAKFRDHADALEASCADLRLSLANLVDFRTGLPSGQVLSAGDCTQVSRAIAAVEMRADPPCTFTPILDPNAPATCSGSGTIFTEDWETGMDGWTLESVGTGDSWPGTNWDVRSSLPDSRQGSAAFALDSRGGTCAPGGDISGRFAMTSPSIAIPSGAPRVEMRFEHYVETETEYDGGNVLYSVNGGPFQLIPQEAYTFNAPPSRMAAGPPTGQNTSPKAGEYGWHGVNPGEAKGSWGTTIVNLSSLVQPGQSVAFKFDFGQDGCNGMTGWFVDTVQVYSCPAGAPPAASFHQNEISDDAQPDRQNDIDRDGRYRLSWTYPPPPAPQACSFRPEEATHFGQVFQDPAEQALAAGSNSHWIGDPQWVSNRHADTETLGYSPLYTDSLDTALTMRNPLQLPGGSSILLTFDSAEDIEKDFDFAYVEATADNGASWQEVAKYSGLFSGRRIADLSAFAGRTLKIRFRLTSDVIFSFPLYQGWAIDNIRVEVANWAGIGTAGGAARVFDVAGRGDGTYAYRIASLTGICAASPSVGAYSNSRTVRVEVGLAAPTAAFSASPNPARKNTPVTFDASASVDHDTVHGPATPGIVRYRWSFGDGGTLTTTSATTSHSYAAKGIYRVTLTVTDNDGEMASTERQIQITD